jgi:hypothetical protein
LKRYFWHRDYIVRGTLSRSDVTKYEYNSLGRFFEKLPPEFISQSSQVLFPSPFTPPTPSLQHYTAIYLVLLLNSLPS